MTKYFVCAILLFSCIASNAATTPKIPIKLNYAFGTCSVTVSTSTSALIAGCNGHSTLQVFSASCTQYGDNCDLAFVNAETCANGMNTTSISTARTDAKKDCFGPPVE